MVCPPGVDPHFTPGGERSESPLVVAVGRLVPVKRFEVMIEALVRVKRRHPDLVAVIAGEGYERGTLEDPHPGPGGRVVDRLARLCRGRRPGRPLPGGLGGGVESSLREGWGMTVTEAGACGTPAVASRISGHRGAVIDDRSGLLFDDVDGMDDALDAVISGEILRKRLGIGAFEHVANSAGTPRPGGRWPSWPPRRWPGASPKGR